MPETTKRAKRKVRLGVVGGGPGSNIGETHRYAARLDDRYALVTGVFASDADRSRGFAATLGIAPDRRYGSWQEMAEQEVGPPDGLEVVSIMTPNNSHYAIAKAFLQQGIDVICDKPLTTDLDQALELMRLVRQTGLVFGVTYCYTGYPMVRQAREMIRNGELGEIRLLQVEHASGWASTLLEAEGHKQAVWRTTPSIAGKSSVVGDLGTHAHNLARFITGLEISEVSAELASIVPGRQVDDNAHIMLRFNNGAKGMMWVSMVAAGHMHGQRIRVYGEKGRRSNRGFSEHRRYRSMTRTIGIGVIGMGWMGEVHSRSYRAIPDRFHESGIFPRLVVCADQVEARAQAAQKRFGFERSTTDWRAVIADPTVEAVSVAAPNGMHLEINRAAAQAGKHILCEKPVGRDPQETIQSAAAAREAGVLTFVGYNYRWAPLVQYAHQLIAEGKLGQVTHYHGRFLNGYAGAPNSFLSWRFEQEHGLGTLSDLMSHVIDMAHMLAGPITRVTSDQEIFIRRRPIPQAGSGTHYDVGSSEGPMGDVTNEDYVSALVHFESGTRGMLEACRVINGAKCDMSFEVHGTKGAIKWNMERMNELQLQWRNDANPAEDGYTTLLSGPAHPYHRHFNPAWGLNLGYDDLKVIEAYNFLHSIVTGQQGEPGFAEAEAVARVQQAIMRSWESERWEAVESSS